MQCVFYLLILHSNPAKEELPRRISWSS